MATEKSIMDAKQIVVVRPKSATENVGFIYKDFSDLKKLILFVGSKPTIDEEGKLWFKKIQVTENSLVMRDAYGKVTAVLSLEEAQIKFAIVASHEYSESDANQIAVKVAKEGSSRGGATRADIVVALKAAGLEFDARGSKALLEATLAAGK